MAAALGERRPWSFVLLPQAQSEVAQTVLSLVILAGPSGSRAVWALCSLHKACSSIIAGYRPGDHDKVEGRLGRLFAPAVWHVQ